MNEDLINKEILNEIESWSNKMRQREIFVKISPQAIKFITELIKNIQDDPSVYWKLRTSFESLQILAIGRIPEALDMIVQKQIYYHREIYISSWEVWDSLSRILHKFCFIPEKDM